MSFVVTAPETVVTAASQLTGIGSAIEAANAAAAALTTRLLPAAADEVSAGIAALMSTHAQEYQLLGGQLATYHDQLVQALEIGPRVGTRTRKPATRRCCATCSRSYSPG